MTIMYHTTLVVIVVFCTAAHAVEVGDLYKALNTSETLWMMKRNYTRVNHTCVGATRIDLNLTDYKFNQTFMNNTKEESSVLYAKLGCDMLHEYMNVSKIQGQNGTQYTLQFWNDSAKCGILTFPQRSRNLPGCELYAWDSYVNETSDGCEEAYRKICTGNASVVYFNNCTKEVSNIC
nr:uncharacterized protein LOC119169454 [Rhipicephalus microplus]